MATATVSGDTIDRVEIYSGTTRLQTVSSAPYGYSWTGVPLGTYTFTAKAVSRLGLTTSSAPVTVNVNPVALNVGAPIEGEIVFDTSVVVSGDFGGGTPTGISVNGVSARLGTKTYAATVPLTTGPNTLTVTATFPGGSTATRTVHVTKTVPSFTLLSPAPGSTIADDTVSVSGTVTAPPNSALFVNGIAATITSDGRFFLDNVPLVQGANALSITLNAAGSTGTTPAAAAPRVGAASGRRHLSTKDTQDYPINRDGTAPFTLEVDKSSGFAPHAITLTLTNRSGYLFDHLYLDTDGDGTVDYAENPMSMPVGTAQYQINYQYPGVYPLRMTLTRDNGEVIYQATRTVVVNSASQFDAFLGGIYEGMLHALAAGDISAALTHVTGTASARFNEIFTFLNPQLASIVEETGEIVRSTFDGNLAELQIRRPAADNSGNFEYYMVYLIRSEDGLWRIDGM